MTRAPIWKKVRDADFWSKAPDTGVRLWVIVFRDKSGNSSHGPFVFLPPQCTDSESDACGRDQAHAQGRRRT